MTVHCFAVALFCSYKSGFGPLNWYIMALCIDIWAYLFKNLGLLSVIGYNALNALPMLATRPGVVYKLLDVLEMC